MNRFKFLVLLLVIITATLVYRDFDNRLKNIETRYGGKEKLACTEADLQKLMNKRIVRIIGSLGEGSGFPISAMEILTSFHVIEGEPSPKIVFQDGSIRTPISMKGNKNKDIAILYLNEQREYLPYYVTDKTSADYYEPAFGEPVYAVGYPFGSDMPGGVTINKGSFGGRRFDKNFNQNMIQTDISLNQGMSGGPLTNACGQVIGINTLGVAGLSLFVDMLDVQKSWPDLTKEEIAKITIDTTTPRGVVNAFYSYIKAGDLEKAYNLVSKVKLDGRSYNDWKEGYKNTLQVDLIASKVDPKDKNKILIWLISEDWVNGELVFKYFQGEWVVKEENGNLKLNESNIREIQEPDEEWYY